MNTYVDELYELGQLNTSTKWLRTILDANKVMKNYFQNLKEQQRNELLKLLQKMKEFFDVTLGTWKVDPVDF